MIDEGIARDAIIWERYIMYSFFFICLDIVSLGFPSKALDETTNHTHIMNIYYGGML